VTVLSFTLGSFFKTKTQCRTNRSLCCRFRISWIVS